MLVQVFNSLFMQFIEQLHSIIPGSANLQLARSLLPGYISQCPDVIMGHFREHVYPHRHLIGQPDQLFPIMMGLIESAPGGSTYSDEIRAVWATLSMDNKVALMEYVTMMVKIVERQH